MAVIAGRAGATPAIGYVTPRPVRVRAWRRRLLSSLIIGCIVAAAAAVVIFTANQVVYNRYDAIVYHGSSSVDAAMDARADVLDNAAANAALLSAQSQAARDQAKGLADQAWGRFQNDLRRSWQNLTDQTNGEFAAFQAADTAQTEYDRAIGAMNAALSANPARPDDARAAFLQANTVLEQRLLPALSSGLEGVKVEDMGTAYASTSSVVRGWLVATLVVSAVLLAVAVIGLWLTRRMHRRITGEVVLALLIVLGIGVWTGVQLRRADTQSKIVVKDAYNTVAGVRDTVALISQQHERESIAIFDTQNQQSHFAAFDSFSLSVDFSLCGYPGCTAKPFLAGGTSDRIDPAVVSAGTEGESNYGLARPPLVSNVRFKGEAAALERARQQYRAFLTADQSVRAALQSNNVAGAASQSADAVARVYSATVTALGNAGGAARTIYDASWHSVQDASEIGRVLALGEIVAAALLARGLWRRRAELYPARAE